MLRGIPPVHEFQKDERFNLLMERNEVESAYLTNQLKQVLELVRQDLIKNIWSGPAPGSNGFIDVIFNRLQEILTENFSYTLQRVINATGTILHTNLGRARLSETAARHLLETALHYSNLEYKLKEGERGSRHSHVEKLLVELTGAEAAMVVNNNAAAVYFILTALAKNREVIVSRGQLVEIGGSFRISSIMEESGATLVEIGTTNKTHLSDYEKAITEQTAMIMKVHTSNFKVIGFASTVSTAEMAKLSKNQSIIFYEDLGSGAFYDFQKHGIGEEPAVREVLKDGADIVSFSGDKLLGGPQAGIIAGKKEIISFLKQHQLSRVLRVDKMTLAALEGTLIDYLRGEEAVRTIPVIRDICLSQEDLLRRTVNFAEKLLEKSIQITAHVKKSTAQVGGGTMPEVKLPSVSAVIKHKKWSADQMAQKLRTEGPISIVVRIQNDEVYIDLRTVTPEEETYLIETLASL